MESRPLNLRNKHRNRYRIKKMRYLTICIATLCEVNTGNPRIVFCADRLVTDSEGLTFEQGTPKIVQLLPNCLIMNAGDSPRGDIILKDVFDELGQKNPEELEKMKFQDIVELIQEKYIQRRNGAIEKDIFEPRGMDRKAFYSNLKSFPDWLALIIDNEVRNFNFDVAFIIFGFGINQAIKGIAAYIYELTGSGELKLMNSIGFSIIGIGQYQSLPEITKEPYSPNNSISDALVRTFWAKKSAERMVSVGKETTDLGIMFLEQPNKDGKIISKNVLISDEFKSKLLLEGFERQRQTIKQLAIDVQQNINDVFSGKKSIS